MFGTFNNIAVCGGGNAAHVVIPLLKSRDLQVTLYTPFAEEAARFEAGASAGGIVSTDSRGKELRGAPDVITTDPQVAGKADFFLLVMPAFAHGPTLKALAPHLTPGAVIGAIPARSGFDLQADYLLAGEGCPETGTIYCGQTLPWACRIVEYGRRVRVLGAKASVGLATAPADRAAEISILLGWMLEVNFVPLANPLAVSLGNIGQVIHPGIMYGLLKDYHGAVWQEDQIPPFYQGVTDEVAAIMSRMSEEIVKVAEELTFCFGIDLHEVETVEHWLLRSYGESIGDSSSLARAFCTNQSYDGLKVPVIKKGAGYGPDFKSRYLTEDIPFGLLFSKSVAEMVNIRTPWIDEVIRVAGGWTGKRYLGDDGSVSGPDIEEARIPQNYGIDSAEVLVRRGIN
ncbi:MAG TPA: hypothetical protein ENN91_01640 [Firmicutes bacterium]|nr:hypothetical protein [Bacillota bacterium]